MSEPALGPDYVNDTIWFSPADLEKPGLSDLVDYLEKNTIKNAQMAVVKLEPRSIIYTLEAFKALYDMPDDAEVMIAHNGHLPGYTITAQWRV